MESTDGKYSSRMMRYDLSTNGDVIDACIKIGRNRWDILHHLHHAAQFMGADLITKHTSSLEQNQSNRTMHHEYTGDSLGGFAPSLVSLTRFRSFGRVVGQ